MLRIEKFKHGRKLLHVVVSWDDSSNKTQQEKKKFKTYKTAVGWCASRCYIYILNGFDRLNFVASSNGQSLPIWTTQIKGLKLDDFVKKVIEQTRFLEFTATDEKALYFLKTKQNDIIYATLKLKKLLQKLQLEPTNID